MAAWSPVALNSTAELAFSTIFLPVVSFENIVTLVPAAEFSAVIAASIVALEAMVADLLTPLT